MKRTILYAAAALLLGGCFKSVGYDTDVILKSWVQTESAAELKPAQGVVAYAFEADTVTWTVASYEDALNGVLTRKGTDEAGVSPVQGTAYRVDSVDIFSHEKYSIDWHRPLRTAYCNTAFSAGTSGHGDRYKRGTNQ